MRQVVTLNINTIIDLICCAGHYNHEHLYDDLFEMLDYTLTDSEIDHYCNVMLEDDVYTEDDAYVWAERLMRLRDMYVNR